MKTPRLSAKVVPIEIVPPKSGAGPRPSMGPSGSEARAIARAIAPVFWYYADQYDTKKYWPEVYERVCEDFRRPAKVRPRTLRDAILWKYGHLGKSAIPLVHESLIAQVQRGWSKTVAALPKDPGRAFTVLSADFGGKTRFITVAFLLHLLFPRQVPIIDQHNFRAVNALMAGSRPGSRSKKRPSQYSDIRLIATFMESVLVAWAEIAPESKPNERDLDKFLMMYGKAIKAAA